MTKALLWTEIATSLPSEARRDLEQFLDFSALRTGRPSVAENRLLETLSISLAKRRHVN